MVCAIQKVYGLCRHSECTSGMAGLGSANAVRTRRVAERFYLCGDETSDAGAGLGLVSSRVMLCAAHQAHAVLRILSGERDA